MTGETGKCGHRGLLGSARAANYSRGTTEATAFPWTWLGQPV